MTLLPHHSRSFSPFFVDSPPSFFAPDEDKPLLSLPPLTYASIYATLPPPSFLSPVSWLLVSLFSSFFLYNVVMALYLFSSFVLFTKGDDWFYLLFRKLYENIYKFLILLVNLLWFTVSHGIAGSNVWRYNFILSVWLSPYVFYEFEVKNSPLLIIPYLFSVISRRRNKFADTSYDDLICFFDLPSRRTLLFYPLRIKNCSPLKIIYYHANELYLQLSLTNAIYFSIISQFCKITMDST